MIFLELVLENFGPYCGRQVINLDPNNDDNPRPIILLGGMNGGGKTTLMDAIRLALYGHRAQCSTRDNLSYNDFLNQCINTHKSPTEQTRIELAFEHIENDKPVRYRIVRTWEKNPKDGKDHLGILDIRENDEWLDTGLVSIWDEYIENLLPLGISNLFLFDGEQVKELAEQEQPPTMVVEAIRALLGLELAERLAIDLEILVNRKRKELADTKELANLEEIEKLLNNLQSEYEETKNIQTQELEFLQQAEKNQQVAFDKFLSEGGKIASESSQLEQQKIVHINESENTRQRMSELAAGVLPLTLIEPLLNQVQQRGEAELKIQQQQIARDILLERDERLLNLIDQTDIAADKFAQIKTFLEKDVEARNALLKESPWLLADAESLSQLGNILYYLQTAKNTAKQQLEQLKNQEEEIITLERQIQAAASPEDYQKLVDLVKKAQNKVTDIKSNCETVTRRLIELETEINKLKKDLTEYSVQTIEQNSKENIINASTRVQQTLKLFRERLTLRKLNKLENEVTECFRYLLHKSDLVHRIVINTNTFSLSLYDLNSQPVDKHRLSAGEKQLLAIAFLWALARVSGHHLPVAIDTPLGRLDSSHRSNLIERYFPSASHQVILLSTDTEIGEKEVKTLRKNEAIAREYLLKYSQDTRQTTVESGYFW
ncbi:DNA sulfur modification protein DndD [Plectonema cf. radiosum LEGE 06105]|uniref:Nuclease SbcCD subunit C n=1 Tax=Plectonema cf. radiosum LEGE 06105 TaxID=945769 RepID=A0A8J7EZZ8_9CYAN|nr:DNA sulfur modification protein DndD [Plectonema radiosum]MBE9211905.1 DNA sulfur modification protein DndD [Plectonema cf. radiosum LEGE 06105]